MSEEINMPNPPEYVGAPEKKKKTVLWIILALVACLLVCLCMVVVVGVVVWSMTNGDWDSNFYYHIPTLLSLI